VVAAVPDGVRRGGDSVPSAVDEEDLEIDTVGGTGHDPRLPDRHLADRSDTGEGPGQGGHPVAGGGRRGLTGMVAGTGGGDGDRRDAVDTPGPRAGQGRPRRQVAEIGVVGARTDQLEDRRLVARGAQDTDRPGLGGGEAEETRVVDPVRFVDRTDEQVAGVVGAQAGAPFAGAAPVEDDVEEGVVGGAVPGEERGRVLVVGLDQL
jgi:hypothetical protein